MLKLLHTYNIVMALSTLCIFSLSFFVVYGRELHGKPGFFIGSSANRCPAERREPWSYRGQNGPPFWGLRYPDCYGYQQSPIAISSTDAERDENLAKLALNNYDNPVNQASIVNNGHTIQVVPQDDVSRTISVNGDDSYSLRQFHFHWGDVYYRGSEHTLDGTQYAMEVHFVHMNEQNQIAVVGVFFQEQDENNEELQKIVDELSNVKYKGDTSSVQSSINLNNLLPANPTSYYRYQGSLTTPACSEGVTWSVVPDPIPVGRDQMFQQDEPKQQQTSEINDPNDSSLAHVALTNNTYMKQFRDLYSVEKENAKDTCKLVNNYRPEQPLLGRKVYLSQ